MRVQPLKTNLLVDQRNGYKFKGNHKSSLRHKNIDSPEVLIVTKAYFKSVFVT